MLRPPKRAGKENKHLCISLGASWPVSFGNKVVRIEYSIGLSRWLMLGVVRER